MFILFLPLKFDDRSGPKDPSELHTTMVQNPFQCVAKRKKLVSVNKPPLARISEKKRKCGKGDWNELLDILDDGTNQKREDRVSH